MGRALAQAKSQLISSPFLFRSIPPLLTHSAATLEQLSSSSPNSLPTLIHSGSLAVILEQLGLYYFLWVRDREDRLGLKAGEQAGFVVHVQGAFESWEAMRNEVGGEVASGWGDEEMSAIGLIGMALERIDTIALRQPPVKS